MIADEKKMYLLHFKNIITDICNAETHFGRRIAVTLFPILMVAWENFVYFAIFKELKTFQ